MSKAPMNIVIAINRKYIRYSYVLLTSLLRNHSRTIHVYILHHQLTAEDEAVFAPLASSYDVSFHFIYVKDSLLPTKEVLSTSEWGMEAYFRLAIVDLLPKDITRALYLDSDIIIHDSLDSFYDCDMGDYKIAACAEFDDKPPYNSYRDELFQEFFDDNFSYFNSGVVLYNLSELRPKYCFDYYMQIAKKLNYQIKFPDQDLLNYCHHGETLYADTFRYNLNARYAHDQYNIDYQKLTESAVVVHYATSKPWRSNYLHQNNEQLWWDYAKHTPFYKELLEEMIQELIMDNSINSYVVGLLTENQKLYGKIDSYDLMLKDAGIIV